MKKNLAVLSSDLFKKVDLLCHQYDVLDDSLDIGNLKESHEAFGKMATTQNEVEAMLRQCFEEGNVMAVFHGALEKFASQQKWEEASLLEESMHIVASTKVVHEGDQIYFHSMQLAPVFMALPADDATHVLSSEACDALSRATQQLWKQGVQAHVEVTVDPVLWEPQDVFALLFPDVYAKNIAPDTAELAKRGASYVQLDKSKIASVGLRFICFWRKNSYPHKAIVFEEEFANEGRDEFEDYASGISDEELEENLAASDAWRREVAKIMATASGAQCVVELPGKVNESIHKGTQIWEGFKCNTSLTEQLAMTVPPPEKMNLHVTVHGEEGVITQGEVRFSIVNPAGMLLAGCTMKLTEWFDLDDMAQLIPKIEQGLAVDQIHQADTVYPVDTGPAAGYYFTPKGWVKPLSAIVNKGAILH